MEFQEYRVRLGKISGAYGGSMVSGAAGDIVLLPPADAEPLVKRGLLELFESAKTVDVEVPPLPPPATTPPAPSVIPEEAPLLNLNTCTVEELEALPNIGQRTARLIVEKRPYSSVDEVPSKAGLGGVVKANWYQVAPKVTV